VLACFLVLPGTVLRGWPHLRELAGAAEEGTKTTFRVEESRERSLADSRYRSWWLRRPSLQRLALGFSVEISLHIALLVAILRSATLAALFAALPGPARAATTLFSAMLMTGFLAGHKETYPFVAWRMYSNQPTRDPIVPVVEGERRSGSRVGIELGPLLPALGPRRLSHIVRQQAQALTTGDDTEDERRLSDLRSTLLAIAGLYNARHPDDPLVRIRAFLAIVPLDATESPWLRHRRGIAGVEVNRPS
jgi:hypothetical protein